MFLFLKDVSEAAGPKAVLASPSQEDRLPTPCSWQGRWVRWKEIHKTITGWCFGTFFIFHFIYAIILPIGFHIFQDGYIKPPTS
jgi:hypothetical protein